MGKQRIVIAVLLSVLENRYAGHGRVCRCAEVKAPGGGVDELALEKYKTSLPPNHARLIGKRAEPSQRGVGRSRMRPPLYRQHSYYYQYGRAASVDRTNTGHWGCRFPGYMS